MASAVQRSALIIPFVVLFMTLPFTTNHPAYYVLYGVFFLVIFPLYVLVHSRKEPIYLLAELKQKSPRLMLLLALFALAVTISWVLVLTRDVSFAQKALATQRYLTAWILVFYSFMLAKFLRYQPLSSTNIFSPLIIGNLILMALFLISYWLLPETRSLNWSIDPPFGSHVRMMGMTASIAVVCCAVLLLVQNNNGQKQGLLLAALFLVTGFIVWTGSRTSLVASFVLVLLLAIFSRMWLKREIKLLAAVFAVMLLSIPAAEQFAVFEWSGLKRTIAVSVKNDQAQNAAEFAGQFTSGRMEMWKVAFDGIAERPIFGQGPHAYYFLKDRPGVYYHTHNVVIESLLEWGVVGALTFFALLMGFVVYAVKNLPKAFKYQDVSWIMAASIALLLSFNALTDGIYFLLFPSFFLVTAFVGFLAIKPSKHQHNVHKL